MKLTYLLTYRGDSGTLVYSLGDDAVQQLDGVESRHVYGMAVGKVELANGTSFTVASRLCDILPAIHQDQRNSQLFTDYKELNLCSETSAEQGGDSGFSSQSNAAAELSLHQHRMMWDEIST